VHVPSFPFRFALVACALFLIACAGRARSGSDEAPAASRPAAASPFEEGRRLYTQKCDGCHVLPQLGAHSPEKWDRILDRMKVEARLSPREDHLVRNFVIASAAMMPPEAPR
jgi:cytochrome c5